MAKRKASPRPRAGVESDIALLRRRVERLEATQRAVCSQQVEHQALLKALLDRLERAAALLNFGSPRDLPQAVISGLDELAAAKAAFLRHFGSVPPHCGSGSTPAGD